MADNPDLQGLAGLIERQRARGLESCADAGVLLDKAAAAADLVALLTDDPARSPESWDMAVILPELLRDFPGRLTAVALLPDAAREVARRFGVGRLPSLLFLRGGHYVGVLEGVYDWAMLAPAVERLLATPPSRPPGIGIPVTASPTSCR